MVPGVLLLFREARESCGGLRAAALPAQEGKGALEESVMPTLTQCGSAAQGLEEGLLMQSSFSTG